MTKINYKEIKILVSAVQIPVMDNSFQFFCDG